VEQLFPHVYHAGFNHAGFNQGFNMAEAIKKLCPTQVGGTTVPPFACHAGFNIVEAVNFALPR
jgi:hypothetical protein